MPWDKTLIFKIRIGMSALLVMMAAGLFQFRTLIYTQGWVKISRLLQFTEIAGWIGIAVFSLLTLLLWSRAAGKFLDLVDDLVLRLQPLRWLALLAAAFLMLLFPILVMGEYGKYLGNWYTRQALFLFLVTACALLLSIWHAKKNWLELLPIALLAAALVSNIAFYLPGVTNYPFALSWSETSRYYNASLFFDQKLYGVDLPWPHRDATRYLMQGVPFLLDNSPLWLHRLWQVLLSISLSLLSGFAIVRRLKTKNSTELILLTIWASLFLFQGPVFYPLLVMVAAVAWGFDSHRFWRSTIVVVVASIWAGWTRINWIPMPGLMAAIYYFLERPVGGRNLKHMSKYLWQPVVWVAVGSLMGLGAQAWYIANSGLDPSIFQSSFSSALLWYRLLPNPSYDLGIFPSIVLVTLPALFVLLFSRRIWSRWHWVRSLGLSAILFVLFLGGLVVSVKIGGGTNLHNLDAFLVVLLLIVVYFFTRTAVDPSGNRIAYQPGWLHYVLLLLFPVLFAVGYGRPVPELDQRTAFQILAELQTHVDKASRDGGEVLFISNRHLITFGYIQGVEIVHDYENLLLMEMAMANNLDYLGAFEADMKAQKFSLIVNNPFPVIYKAPKKYSLAQENNIYLRRVNPRVLCFYMEHEPLIIPPRGHLPLDDLPTLPWKDIYLYKPFYLPPYLICR